jgi:hypothetical protein
MGPPDLETRPLFARGCELEHWHALGHAWELRRAPWRRPEQADLRVHPIDEGRAPAGKVHQVIAWFERLRQAGMRSSAQSAPADSWLCAYFCRTTTGCSPTNSACSLSAHGCSIHALDLRKQYATLNPWCAAPHSPSRWTSEHARLDLLASFRALDQMGLSAAEIPQRPVHQRFELVPIMWKSLGAQGPGSLNLRAMPRGTWAALEQLPGFLVRSGKTHHAPSTLPVREVPVGKTLGPPATWFRQKSHNGQAPFADRR